MNLKIKASPFWVYRSTSLKTRENWLEAISTDGLVWTQLSDSKAWYNEAAKLYDVNAIPMNFSSTLKGRS